MNPSPAPIVAEPGRQYRARTPIVVDCSVLAAILFDEPGREGAADVLTGKELHAPWLIDPEMASVAIKKRAVAGEEAVQLALADYATLRLTRYPADPIAQLRLAVENNLSAYDAAYLQLAIYLGAPLATFDRTLGAAAQRVLTK